MMRPLALIVLGIWGATNWSAVASDVVARAGNQAIYRSQLKLSVSPQDPNYRRELTRQVNWHYQLILLNRILRVEPSEKIARQYVELRVLQCLPAQREKLKRLLEPMIAHRDFQLQAALHLQFLSEDPGAMKITPPEIAQFFQTHPEKFQRPGQADISVMKLGAPGPATTEKLQLVQARLLQGENFDQVAQQFDPGAQRQVAPPEVAVQIRLGVEKMKEGEYRIFRSPNGTIFLARLNRKQPPKKIPLAEVAPLIREQLAAQKLQKKLRSRLEQERKLVPLQKFY